ncbi:ABC transporter permease subunit [Nakamurella antarctica]|uniref:ABC transporter permease subunit n=1 Tax=Nakamurella antarctica TaxID=1902245 RepID=A0A3G8ZNI5_9ACTN|nr:ABC transporter permease subunit [Nakamurella antarctica]AZI58367.1 ABC transporter permease subunit [Nakamurella antarctica]
MNTPTPPPLDSRARRGRSAAVGGGAAVLVVFALLPILALLIWAVAGQWRYPDLLPRSLSMRALERLFDPRQQIITGLLTSLGVAAAVTILACGIGYPAGRALGLYRFRGRRLVQFFLLAPVIVPGVAVTLGIQVFFIRFNLADTVVGVIAVQLMPTVPYAATVLAGAFANFDPDYERQARALGARPWRTFLHVTFPILRPALILAAVFTSLISWSEYILTFLIGGGQVKTLPLLLFSALSTSDTSSAAALAVLLALPPLLLVAVTSRCVRSGSVAAIGFARL